MAAPLCEASVGVLSIAAGDKDVENDASDDDKEEETTSVVSDNLWIMEESYLFSRVPGKQTVPRAEAWAIYLVLQVWDGTHDLAIVTDASYTYSGMDLHSRQKHLKRHQQRHLATHI